MGGTLPQGRLVEFFQQYIHHYLSSLPVEIEIRYFYVLYPYILGKKRQVMTLIYCLTGILSINLFTFSSYRA